jgi:hypothetical protein
MPTIEHASLVEMFRKNPDIAPHFLETLFGRVEIQPRRQTIVALNSSSMVTWSWGR